MSELLVCGTRTITDKATIMYIIDHVLCIEANVRTIIHGGCRGVDTMCNLYSNRYTIVVVSPEWNKYGKRAGPLRNQTMVDMCDVVLVIVEDMHDMSRGSKSTYEYANASNRKMYVYCMRSNVLNLHCTM